jgi:hypothetical protein
MNGAIADGPVAFVRLCSRRRRLGRRGNADEAAHAALVLDHDLLAELGGHWGQDGLGAQVQASVGRNGHACRDCGTSILPIVTTTMNARGNAR